MENKFDRDIRDRMKNHPSEMDLDRFWNNLEPKLPEKKKRRFFFWWIWIPILIGAPLTFFMIKYGVSEESSVTLKNDHSPDSPAVGPGMAEWIEQKDSGSGVPGNPGNLPAYAGGSDYSNDLASVGLSKTRSATTAKSTKLKAANFSESKEDFNKAGLSNSSADRKVSKNIPTFAMGPGIPSTINTSIDNKNEPGLKDQSDKMLPVPDGMDQREKSDQKDRIPENVLNSGHTKDLMDPGRDRNIFPDSNPISISPASWDPGAVSLRDSIPDMADVNPVRENENVNDVLSGEMLQYEKDRKQGFIYLKPEIGLGGYVKYLNTVVDSLSMYLQNRRNSESKLEEWTGTLLLGAKYGKWKLETGIQYLQRNEKFEFHQQKKYNGFGLTLADIEYAGGQRDTTFVDAWYVRNYSRKVIHYNAIQQWNIPLNVGIDFLNRDKWSLGFQTGLLISISNQMKGRILNEQAEIKNLDELEIGKVRKSLGLGMTMGANSMYRLNGRYSLTAAIQYMRFFKTYLNGPVEQGYHSGYLNLGLQIKI